MMKYFKQLVIALFLCSINVFSQENNIKHTIVKGETISSIAQKYNVSIPSIYKLNPKAKKTLQLNQVLLIPNPESKKGDNLAVADTEKTTEIKHQIAPKETLYGITKQFKTTTELLYKANPKLETEGLKVGQTITIPSSLTKTEIASLSNLTGQETAEKVETVTSLTHEVKPKESLYVIAKMYGVSLKELQEANPKIGKKGIKVGQTIDIPSNGKMPENEVVAEEVKSVVKESVPTKETKTEIASLPKAKEQTNDEKSETVTPLTHEVKQKESLYVIAKMYGVTLKELQNANPKIGKKGIRVGQTLVIPSNGKMPEKEVAVEDEKSVVKESVPAVAEKESNAKETKTEAPINTSEIIHEVLTKETKYGIAKKYGITVTELEKQNPTIKQKLKVGSKLTIQVPNDKFEEINKDKVVENKEGAIKEVASAVVKDTTAITSTIPSRDLIDKLIQSATEMIGTRYRSGGTTTAGFDCSGLMYSTFASFDIKLPRSSIEQASIGDKINDEDVQKGDLIFFRTNGRHHINHVGMVIEVAEDEIKFIHSSTHSGVIISSTKEPYYQRNFAQVNRVVK